MDKKTQGKKSRVEGKRFELKVRSDLESKNWIVAKWTNNVEFKPEIFNGLDDYEGGDKIIGEMKGKLVKVRNMFLGPGRPMMLGAGFPDFICFKNNTSQSDCGGSCFNVILVEAKSNGYLDKTEKEKCKWLLENEIVEEILIAKKGIKRGKIVYIDFKSTTEV